MDFSDMTTRALEIRQHYEAFETEQYGRPWTVGELTLGFMGDVGDLTKLVLAHEGVRAIPEHQHKLEHELADCLWSIVVLAEKCGVNLEQAFGETMGDLEKSLA